MPQRVKAPRGLFLCLAVKKLQGLYVGFAGGPWRWCVRHYLLWHQYLRGTVFCAVVRSLVYLFALGGEAGAAGADDDAA